MNAFPSCLSLPNVLSVGFSVSHHVKKKTLFSRSCSIKEANDMQTLLDRNIYIFHSRVQTAVSASQGNFETRWSLSHTKHHEKNRLGRVGARGILDKCWCTWQFSILGDIRGFIKITEHLHDCTAHIAETTRQKYCGAAVTKLCLSCSNKGESIGLCSW